MTPVTRLGELERAAMQVVWHAGTATAREVAGALSDRGLAYTTWLTVLGRLERKGLLARAKVPREAFAAVYGRAPDAEESASAEAFLTSRPDDAAGAVRDLLWALMTSAEFLTAPQ